jgi:hypothetical protein
MALEHFALDFRTWHETDLPGRLTNVRSSGKTGSDGLMVKPTRWTHLGSRLGQNLRSICEVFLARRPVAKC